MDKPAIVSKLEALKASPFKSIIVAQTGSVATIKGPELVQSLLDLNVNVIYLQTKSSEHFASITHIN